MKAKLILLATLYCALAFAGPSRPIQSSSFSAQTPCGPAHDPLALQGQWFLDKTGATNVNAREYHDEDNAMSISGVVQNITFANPANTNSNIVAFEILAVVFNTLPSDYTYGSASNSHGEVQSPLAVDAGGSTMTEVRITAEFALVNSGVTPSGTPPYWGDPLSAGQYHIVAGNAQEHAWYCWDPNQQNPLYQPAGAYQVPAWNLTPSTIPPGGSASVLMQFTVTNGGIPLSDYRHGVIRYSQQTGADVLYNRTPSLKISHWLDTIVIDNGVTLMTPPFPYWDGEPIEYIHASDASVFYNSEEEEEFDWGDAPDAPVVPGFNYSTLAINNGANHTIVQGVYMGVSVDAEADGQPTPAADGDDLNGAVPFPPGDEDGVGFMSPLIPGQNAHFNVSVSAPGWLDVWLDVDATLTWTAPDHIWSGPVNSGPNPLLIPIPYNTVPGTSYMRFRYNTIGPLPVDGGATDGEVEDYEVWIEEPEYDFGDAPDPSYPTWSSSVGAQHIIATGVLLGSSIDPEMDGQPTPQADGDDTDGNNDDDGITFVGKIVASSNATINVTAGPSGGYLDAWIDFDANGTWAPVAEHLFGGTSYVLTPGSNPSIVFPVPGLPAQALGETFARFRISSAGGLPPDNAGIPTPDGEVEDYRVELFQPLPVPDIVITNLFFTNAYTVAQVEWNSQSGITYQMQASTNLTTNVWVDVGATVLGPVNWQTNNMAAQSNKFYRVTAPWTE